MIRGARFGIYQGHGTLMLQSTSQTDKGHWIGMGTGVQLPDDASDAELGRAIVKVLEESRTGAPHPPPGISASDYGRPFLKAMGFRSLRALTRGTKAVIAAEKDGRLEVDVQGRDGLLTGETVTSSSLDPTAMAQAVREALAKSDVIWE